MAGPVYVEDNSLANAFAEIFKNPGVGGAQIANVRSEIAKRETDRQKILQEMENQRRVLDAQTKLPGLAAGVTAAEAVPVPPDYQKNWATGAGTIGTENVPLLGPAPLQAFSPDQERANV